MWVLVLLLIGSILISLGAEILPTVLETLVLQPGYWRKPAFWICLVLGLAVSLFVVLTVAGVIPL